MFTKPAATQTTIHPNQIRAGTFTQNFTFSGTNTFSGTTTLTGTANCTIINQVRCIGATNPQGWAGTDPGGWINSAITNCPAAPTVCEIDVGADINGSAGNFSTAISITTKTVHLRGLGATMDQNAGVHSAPRLTWTGGASIPITISGTAASGTHITNIALNNTGTATTGILIDQQANSVVLDGFTEDRPAVTFSTACMQLGSNTLIDEPTFIGVRLTFCSAGWGVVMNNVSGPMNWYHPQIIGNVLGDVLMGNATVGPVGGTRFFGANFNGSGTAGRPDVSIVRAEDVLFLGGYFEYGDTAVPVAGYAVDIPSTAQVAQNIVFVDTTFRRTLGTERAATVAIHSNFSSAQVMSYGSSFVSNGGGVAMTQVVQNDASQLIAFEGSVYQLSGMSATSNIANGTAGMVGVTNVDGIAAGTRMVSAFGDPGLAAINTAGTGQVTLAAGGGSGKFSLTLPLISDVVVTRTNGETLSGKTLSSPTISLLTNGTGLQIFNTTTTCTTAASVGATCTTANISLPVAEADTSYRVSCTAKPTLTAVPVVIATTNVSATQFTITIAALTAVAASAASYDCVAGHN